MITYASRAFAAVALPVLVALGTASAARASEGHDMAAAEQPARPAATASATPAAPVAAAILATTSIAPTASAPTATHAHATHAPATWRQHGTASWYGGRRWQGKRTASGTRYDERQLTAAHASLPLGSRVRVTVADTGRSVVVTINDRPGTRRRIIDLSRAAAVELGILSRGVAQVALTRT